MGKTNVIQKKYVDVTVCYYCLNYNKYRYVFFFYDPSKREPIHKWVYYQTGNEVDTFKQKFNEEIESKNFRINKNVVLCMCNENTKISTVKIPKTITYLFNKNTIIKNELMSKFGKDYESRYYVDNQIDGFEEKNAEKNQTKAINKTKREAAQERLLRTARLINGKNNTVKLPQDFKISEYFCLAGSFLLSLFFSFIIGSRNTIGGLIFGIITLLCFLALYGFYLIKLLVETSKIKKSKINIFYILTVGKLIHFIYSILPFVVVSLSLVFELALAISVRTSILNYLIFGSVYVITLLIFELLRNRLRFFVKIIYFKPKSKKKAKKGDDEEDGSNNENLFNMSKKTRGIFANKNRKTISYRQLLVDKESYSYLEDTLNKLGLKINSIRTLPSLINQFHYRYSRNLNEIIVYNEAGFNFLIGFVKNQIVNFAFISNSEKVKTSDGSSINLHLNSLKNSFSCLLWDCQKISNKIDQVVYMGNSEKILSDIKEKNIFDLPSKFVNNTDVIFGENINKKSASKEVKGFTLIETVVALVIFAITSVLVASTIIASSQINRLSTDKIKANSYIGNISEIMNYGNVEDSIESITTTRFVEDSVVNQTYYVDSDFSLYSATQVDTDREYKVDVILEKHSYIVSGQTLQAFTTYSLTVNEIKRVGSNRDLIDPIVIEVAK